MRILLELQGWRKTIEIDNWMIRRGYVEVALHPPTQCLCSPKDLINIPMSTAKTVRFFYAGQVTKKAGLRIFRYDE